jgi:leucyl aminopeptidase
MKVSLLLLTIVTFVASLPSQEIGEGRRLVKFTEEDPSEWLTPAEVDLLAAKDVNFMDITDHIELGKGVPPKLFDIPTIIRFQPTVAAAIAKLNISRIQGFMEHFVEYHNRYYTTETGIEASNWLFAQIQNAIVTSGYKGSASVAQFNHSVSWPQPSIIARIQGTNSSAEGPVVILGAHLDSITSGAAGKAPGADDNASGSATILETFRGLLESGFVPRHNVEFQWYAAEEVGLRGSQAIANQYKAQGREVIGMINFDMTGYFVPPDTRIGILTDYTDPTLTQFLRLIVDAYNQYDWVNTSCGYACSDHASWHQAGYRASRPRESYNRSPYLHTLSDTISNLSYDRVIEFSKLAAGFAIELAEPSN